MFPLFETIRIVDGHAQQLEYHQARMERTAKAYFGVPSKLDVTQLVDVPEMFREGLVKLRLDYGIHSYSQAYTFYKPRLIRTLRVVQENDINYQNKSTNRSQIERLWSRRGPCDDILIIKDGMVTDTSYTNILFLQGDHWVTPNTPLLEGTQRAYLLDSGLITEESIPLDDLRDYHGFQLVNAMMPFDKNHVMDINGIHD